MRTPTSARYRRAIAVLPVAGLLAAGCGASDDPSARPPSPTSAQASGSPGTIADTLAAAAVTVDRFIRAANGGDVAALRVLFATDARFDRAGVVFTGRDEIIDGFLKPDVIDPGGRYHESARRIRNGRLVVSFVFDTGHGGQERFTYDFLVRDGQITEVIGRYI